MKENKIEKLILDLSNRWECTPQEAVDRLNSMNESEINKLINSMTKKFKNGGMIDCLRAGGSVSNCKCGQTLKAQTGEKVMFAPDPRDAKENHDLRFWGRVLPKMGYDEYNKSTKTGLIHPGYEWINENIRTAGEVTQRKYSNDDWDNPYLVVDNRINPNPNESASAYIERWEDFENKLKRAGIPTGLVYYRNGGSVEKCKCGDRITKHQQTSIIGKQVDGMGLPVQLPNKTKDLKYSNIISNGVTGKAATWIPKDGKSQVTEFLMADNNPDVPGYTNDIKMEISRNPRTGELGRDTVLRSKILPGIYGIGLPIKYRSDAYVVRNAKKRK